MRAYFVIALERRHVLHGYYVCVFELWGIVDVFDLSWDEQQQSRVNASTIASRIIPFKSNLYFGTLSSPAHFSILATRYKVLRTHHHRCERYFQRFIFIHVKSAICLKKWLDLS